MKYIGIGKCTKYNIYILTAFLSELLINSLFGLNSSNYNKPVRIFPFRGKIKSHKLLDKFIHFSGFFFGGLFLYIFEKCNISKMKNDVSIEEYEKMKEKFLDIKGQSTIIELIIVGILFSLFILFSYLIDLNDLTFWPIEILYIAIISYWIFKNKIHIHKKVAIGIMFLVTIIDFIENFFPSTKHKNLENELTDKNIYEKAIIKYGAYSIPLYYLANELIHIQRDYCWTKSKYLMDIKSLSPYKIMLSTSIFGFIFVIILSLIFTYVPCKTFNNINKKENNYYYNNTNEPVKLYLEYCSLNDYDENTKTLYLFYDSLKLISREYSNTDKNNMIEIFVIIPLLFIFYMINEISRLMLIRYIDPTIILIYRNFYYFLLTIMKIIVNKADEQYFTITSFILNEIEDLTSIISGLIYTELLELKFCGLDYELKKNIDRRGIEDIEIGHNLKDNESEESDIDTFKDGKMKELQEISALDK